MLDINFKNLNSLRIYGFSGFASISYLQESECIDVPIIRGVYLVLYIPNTKPIFLEESVGGHFNGNNPTVSIERLNNKWINNVKVIYIGKAGGENNQATLRSRIGCYMRFGQGTPVGHWGGRFIWQIANSNSLKICWKPTPNENPREIESELILEFKRQNNDRLPFANLRH